MPHCRRVVSFHVKRNWNVRRSTGTTNISSPPVMAMFVSFNKSCLNKELFQACCVIQKKDVSPNIAITIFSSLEILPSSLSFVFNKTSVPSTLRILLGNSIRVIIRCVVINSSEATGTPTSIHFPKLSFC